MASPVNTTGFKIGDYLQSRDKQTNFGICKRCEKKVYWSTNKVVSHIRSGHCSGASTDEVDSFKRDFVYQSPKNLVHRLKLKNELGGNNTGNNGKQQLKVSASASLKKESGMEITDEADDTDEYPASASIISDPNCEFEIHFVPEPSSNQSRQTNESQAEEEKFINAVYPQFKGKSKLQLIDEILDLQRRNDLLQDKASTYEKTIKRLL